jgi:hypothetical protein
VLVAAPSKLDEVRFGRKEWQCLEIAYRHKVPVSVRKRIRQATQRYAAAARFEHDAASAADARKYLVKIRKAATDLGALITPVDDREDGPAYARHLLLNHIRDERLGRVGGTLLPSGKRDPRSRDPLSALIAVVRSCVTACDSGCAELDNPDFVMREGESWDRWICDLTAILERQELPVAASKGKSNYDRASPFVSLVLALQDSLPFNRHRHSHLACAKAIGLARQAARHAERGGLTARAPNLGS